MLIYFCMLNDDCSGEKSQFSKLILLGGRPEFVSVCLSEAWRECEMMLPKNIRLMTLLLELNLS